MATGQLGEQIDIHCGGVDNIFPHHEAEMHRAKASPGKNTRALLAALRASVGRWTKMSKSLGNFYTLPDVLEKGYTGRELATR